MAINLNIGSGSRSGSQSRSKSRMQTRRDLEFFGLGGVATFNEGVQDAVDFFTSGPKKQGKSKKGANVSASFDVKSTDQELSRALSNLKVPDSNDILDAVLAGKSVSSLFGGV